MAASASSSRDSLSKRICRACFLSLFLPLWAGLVLHALSGLAEEGPTVRLFIPAGLTAAGFALHRILRSRGPEKVSRFVGFLSTLEHELTHAAVALVFLRPPKSLHVTEEGGGYLTLSEGNWFIGLAPYAVPLYASAVLLLGCFVREPWGARCATASALLYGAFLSELLKSIHPKQTDLVCRGYLQSVVWVMLFQILLLCFSLDMAVGNWSWGGALSSAKECYARIFRFALDAASRIAGSGT